MSPNLSPTTLPERWTLHKLRPPSRKPLYVLANFASSTGSFGCVYRLSDGEPVISPGDGTVVSIRSIFATWAYTPGNPVANQPRLEITIDHGNNILTVVHGLDQSAVNSSQPVKRGDLLGSLAGGELFFQVKWLGTPYDPCTISRHFRVQDPRYSAGRTGYLRQGPDLLPVTVASDLAMVVAGGLHYFVNIFNQQPPFLINIDFNGSGTYSGPAAVGSDGDYWNVYTPIDFLVLPTSCFCGVYYSTETCFNYSSSPSTALLNAQHTQVLAWMESVASLLQIDNGVTATWNAMLGTWIGGYAGDHVPIQSAFRLHELPPGTYNLYLYANETDLGNGSDYYVQVDNGPLQHLTTHPTGAVTFIAGDNYALFSNLQIVSGSIITVEAVGFLAGLQITRI